jgi:hypothetical protein
MVRLANMTIPSGTQVSNEIDVTVITHLAIYSPAALTGVIGVEISPDKGVTWYVTGLVPVIDDRVHGEFIHADKMRLTSTINEAADRIFPVQGSGIDTA